MTSKLIALVLIAGGSVFAQSRFSFSIGISGPGYYAPQREYYTQARPYYGNRSNPFWRDGAGYWGENPERQHRRTEWRGLRNHHAVERDTYGNSRELREHQAEERRRLRHEQRHERNGDYDAAYGPAHGSARDGMNQGHSH